MIPLLMLLQAAAAIGPAEAQVAPRPITPMDVARPRGPTVAPPALAPIDRRDRLIARADALLKEAAQRRAALPADDARRAELDALVEEAADARDSLSDLGEVQQMKMQMATDRMAKAAQMLSNLMKKLSDTANTITGNLK